MTDETLQADPVEAQIREILTDWTILKIEPFGTGHIISGIHRNKAHAGGRDQLRNRESPDDMAPGVELALDLKRIADTEDLPAPRPENFMEAMIENYAPVPTPPVAPEIEPEPELEPQVQAAPDLDALKEALRLRILAEAVRRSGMSMELFERINAVHAVISDENSSAAAKTDAELELQMHGVWSERAKVIDAAKTQKLVEVMGLETLDDINAYDVNAGWP